LFYLPFIFFQFLSSCCFRSSKSCSFVKFEGEDKGRDGEIGEMEEREEEEDALWMVGFVIYLSMVVLLWTNFQ